MASISLSVNPNWCITSFIYTDESSAFAIITGARYNLPLKDSMAGSSLPDNLSVTQCKKPGELFAWGRFF